MGLKCTVGLSIGLTDQDLVSPWPTADVVENEKAANRKRLQDLENDILTKPQSWGGKGPTVIPVGASYGPLTYGIYELIQVPWNNEHPLDTKELNVIIGAWFTLASPRVPRQDETCHQYGVLPMECLMDRWNNTSSSWIHECMCGTLLDLAGSLSLLSAGSSPGPPHILLYQSQNVKPVIRAIGEDPYYQDSIFNPPRSHQKLLVSLWLGK
ncbi:hypothetical protein Tco_0610182 [Tanacetum coccineum]